MTHTEAIRLLALQAVVRETDEYHIRHIFRWYSKTFHTPLHVVDALPLDDILEAYYESVYEEMSDENLHLEIMKMTEDPEVLATRKIAEDSGDADAMEFARQIEAQETVKPLPAPVIQGLTPALSKLAGASSEFKDATQLRELKETPPDIKMTFMEDEEFQRLLEKDFIPEPK